MLAPRQHLAHGGHAERRVRKLVHFFQQRFAILRDIFGGWRSAASEIIRIAADETALALVEIAEARDVPAAPHKISPAFARARFRNHGSDDALDIELIEQIMAQ